MTVKIVVDSTSDIPPQVASKLGITVVPTYVHFDGKMYRDGLDLTSEQFYHKLQNSKSLPSTAVPSPTIFAEVYDQVAEDADGIIVITASSKLSQLHEMATQAIKLMSNKCRIEIIDSQWAMMATGLLAITAAEAIIDGAGFNNAVDMTCRNIRRVQGYAAFDTLEYVRRGGRIGRAQAFLGSLLKLHPIITIRNGEVFPVARCRSRTKAMDYLYNFACGYSNIQAMAIQDATTPIDADTLANRLDNIFPKQHIYRAKIGPVVGTHTGPHVVGLIVLGDKS